MLQETVKAKYEELRRILDAMQGVAIGYSGGVDSTLLLCVAVETLGDRALAVIGRSATYPTREFEEAVAIAGILGARVRVVNTEETDIVKFRENPPDRCFYCKTELFGKLGGIAAEEGLPWIADGTIMDDLGDFRPGMAAREGHGVRSPLLEAGFTKAEVRELSQHLNLATWDKPSFACLSSRFPYGMSISPGTLATVDAAESLLRDLGFRTFRVRYHDEHTARIEARPQDLPRLLEEEVRQRLVRELKLLGFIYITIDLQGYRSGSMNEVLPADTRARHTS
jgi:uncharacterized protein